MRLHFRPKKAATLVELVVTMVLICIVAITAFSAYAYISAYSIRAHNYATATEFLCDTLERLSASSYASLAIGTFNDPLPAGCNLIKYAPPAGNQREYTVSPEIRWNENVPVDETNGYRNITATITWNDGAGRTLTLSMRKTK